jgi:hypothetical protein
MVPRVAEQHGDCKAGLLVGSRQGGETQRFNALAEARRRRVIFHAKAQRRKFPIEKLANSEAMQSKGGFTAGHLFAPLRFCANPKKSLRLYASASE